jgi:hypothetical protein
VCGERSPSHPSSWRWKAPRLTRMRSLFADRTPLDESWSTRSDGSLQDPQRTRRRRRGARNAASWGSIGLAPLTRAGFDSSDSLISAGAHSRKSILEREFSIGSLARGKARRSQPQSRRQRRDQGKACPGFGWFTRARCEELEGCVHVSSRVAEVVRRCRCPKKPFACFHAGGERGLAQSGRPRRAKWRRKPSRGGKTARSVSTYEEHSQGCRGRWSSFDERRFGSNNPLFFHEKAGEAILADFPGSIVRTSGDWIPCAKAKCGSGT